MTVAFEEKYLTSADGLSLYCRDYNSSANGPPAICLPGLTRNSRDYEELAPRLAAEGWRVLAFDLRGRGRSDYDPNPANYVPATYVSDTFQILDDLSIQSYIVIGTSLGGLMAMMMASVAPGRLKGVVLNDVGPEIDSVGLERIRTYVGKTAARKSWREIILAYCVVNAHLYPDLIDADWETLARRTHRELPNGEITTDYDPNIANAFAAADGVQPALDLWPYFDALKNIPTLAFRGEHSDILSVDTFVRMQERNSRMEAVTVANRGHVPLLNEPECKLAMARFLDSL